MLGTALMAYCQSAPFAVTLSADKYQVTAGSPVDLIVVMTNKSEHDVDCTVNGSNALDRNYVYEVTDEDGQPVPKIEKKYHGGSSVWPCVLKPGQSSLPGGGRISVLYDFSRPGKYTIQVSRGLWGDENRPETAGTGRDHQPFIKSNTIVVTVQPAENAPPAENQTSENQPDSQASQQPFVIRIHANQPQVQAGDPVDINLTMSNFSDHLIDCTARYRDSRTIDMNYQYDVLDEDGLPAPKIESKAPSATVPCTLKPMNSRYFGALLSELYDFSVPGKYSIQVSRPVWGDDQRPGTGRAVQDDQAVVKSNTIVVTVLPRTDEQN